MSDAPALARVHVGAWRAAYAGHMPADYLAGLDPEAFRARWEDSIRAGRTALLIERDALVAGFALFGPSRDADALPSTGELIAINLDPDHWRRGLGKILLAESVSRLAEAGFTDATLWVIHGNDRARRFYEALGWREDGVEKHDRLGGEATIHEVRYRRSLGRTGDGANARSSTRDQASTGDRLVTTAGGGEQRASTGRDGSASMGRERGSATAEGERAGSTTESATGGAVRERGGEPEPRGGGPAAIIAEESLSALTEYARIPIAFEVERIFQVQTHGPGFLLLERRLEAPWAKDYDAIDGEGPSRWASRFDLSRWGLIAARQDGRLVGGAVLAWNTPGVEMLRGRDDLAVLWDLRVLPEKRRAGVGASLFRAAEQWAIARRCASLEVETQNINLGACRFYARQGCTLRKVDPDAYPNQPHEVQLIWGKELSLTGRIAP